MMSLTNRTVLSAFLLCSAVSIAIVAQPDSAIAASQKISKAVTSQIQDAQKSNLTSQIARLTLSSDSANAIKSAMKNSDAADSDKDKFSSSVDSIVKFEKDALGKIQALYGDLGVSSDSKTVFVPAFKGYIFALDAKDGHTRWVSNVGDDMVGGIIAAAHFFPKLAPSSNGRATRTQSTCQRFERGMELAEMTEGQGAARRKTPPESGVWKDN